MPTTIQMPKLGLTMTEGKIAEWTVAEGEKVSKGAVVMLIETDKVEAEVEADADGVVKYNAAVGEVLEPGAVVGYLLADGEDAPAGGAAPEAAPAPAEAAVPADAPERPQMEVSGTLSMTPEGRIIASPNAKRVAEELAIDLHGVTGTGPGGRITSEDVEAAVPASRGLGGRILASPNAKRVAAELGVDLAGVTGTGPGGRITSEDVQASAADTIGIPRPRPTAAPAPAPTASPAAPVAAPASAGSDRFVPFAAVKAAEHLGIDIAAVVGSGPAGRVTRQDVYAHARTAGVGAPRPAAAAAGSSVQPGDQVPLTGMRGIIAERMYSSLQESAQLTLFVDVDMDRTTALRTQLKEVGADELGAVPGYTDFVVAAVSRALRRHPIMNAQIEGDHIQVLDAVNVGLAVAVPDGLVVPVVKGSDTLGLLDLAVETSRLAEAARSKSLKLDDMEGGTFSVTALGMFGVDGFTPVINAPNAGILGVGRLRDDVAWDGDTPKRVQRLTLSLTWDHRVLDGAPAAEFAQSVKQYLEQPVRLLG